MKVCCCRENGIYLIDKRSPMYPPNVIQQDRLPSPLPADRPCALSYKEKKKIGHRLPAKNYRLLSTPRSLQFCTKGNNVIYKYKKSAWLEKKSQICINMFGVDLPINTKIVEKIKIELSYLYKIFHQFPICKILAQGRDGIFSIQGAGLKSCICSLRAIHRARSGQPPRAWRCTHWRGFALLIISICLCAAVSATRFWMSRKLGCGWKYRWGSGWNGLRAIFCS